MRMQVDPQIEVPQYPKISEDCHIIISDDKIQIYGIEQSVVLSGDNSLPVIIKILPLLIAGKSSLDDIFKNVEDEEKELLPYIIKYLYMKGVFEDYSDVSDINANEENETQKYFSRLVDITRYSKNRHEVLKNIQSHNIQIITDSRLGIDFYKKIEETGFKNINVIALNTCKTDFRGTSGAQLVDKFNETTLSNSIGKEAHLVCIFKRNFPKVFSIINKIAFSNNQLLTLCFMKDKSAIIGPTFVPHDTGCYECYEQRQIMNMSTTNLDCHNIYQEFLNQDDTKPFSHAGYNQNILINILTSEIVNISSFIVHPKTIGFELEFNFVDLDLKKRSFLKLPVCNVCSKKVSSSNFLYTGEKYD